MASKQLIAGNWKMHGMMASLSEIATIAASISEGPDASITENANCLICPPFTLLKMACDRAKADASGHRRARLSHRHSRCSYG